MAGVGEAKTGPEFCSSHSSEIAQLPVSLTKFHFSVGNDNSAL